MAKKTLLSFDFSFSLFFSVISCTDEIRQLRYLEAANSEEEYNEENDIQSESSRGQAFFPGHPRGRGKVH